MFLICSFSWANTSTEIIKAYDIRSYSPLKKGIRELSFEVRIDGLGKKINDQKNFGIVNDLHFKVHWALGKEVEISVEGMDQGFNKIKEELINTYIRPRLELVIPIPLSDKFKDYQHKLLDSKNDEKRILAIDPKGINSVYEIIFVFSKNGQLKSMNSHSSFGSEYSTLSLGETAWSDGKWVVLKVKSEFSQENGPQENLVDIEYISIEGIGLPKTVIIKQQLILPEKLKKNIKEVHPLETKIIFSNYQLNSKINKIK